jgi:hypothetical protein
MHRDLDFTRAQMPEQELHAALVGTLLQLDRAARRYTHHRLRHGYDYGCRRLLDELRLSRSLVLALVDEVREQGNLRAAHN